MSTEGKLIEIVELIKDNEETINKLKELFIEASEKDEELILESMNIPLFDSSKFKKFFDRNIPKNIKEKKIKFILSTLTNPKHLKSLDKRKCKYKQMEPEQFLMPNSLPGFFWSDVASLPDKFLFILSHEPYKDYEKHDHYGIFCFDKKIAKKVHINLKELFNKIDKEKFPLELLDIEDLLNNRFYKLNDKILEKQKYRDKNIILGTLFNLKKEKFFFSKHNFIYRDKIILNPSYFKPKNSEIEKLYRNYPYTIHE